MKMIIVILILTPRTTEGISSRDPSVSACTQACQELFLCRFFGTGGSPLQNTSNDIVPFFQGRQFCVYRVQFAGKVFSLPSVQILQVFLICPIHLNLYQLQKRNVSAQDVSPSNSHDLCYTKHTALSLQVPLQYSRKNLQNLRIFRLSPLETAFFPLRRYAPVSLREFSLSAFQQILLQSVNIISGFRDIMNKNQ